MRTMLQYQIEALNVFYKKLYEDKPVEKKASVSKKSKLQSEDKNALRLAQKYKSIQGRKEHFQKTRGEYIAFEYVGDNPALKQKNQMHAMICRMGGASGHQMMQINNILDVNDSKSGHQILKMLGRRDHGYRVAGMIENVFVDVIGYTSADSVPKNEFRRAVPGLRPVDLEQPGAMKLAHDNWQAMRKSGLKTARQPVLEALNDMLAKVQFEMDAKVQPVDFLLKKGKSLRSNKPDQPQP